MSRGSGVLAPPWRPGQSGNPAGRPSNRDLMARELAARLGLKGILKLARRYGDRAEEFADALLDTACDREAKGQVSAARLTHELLGSLIKREDVKVTNTLEVQVYRSKRRVMEDEPEERECEVLEETVGKGCSEDLTVSEEEAPPRPPK
jgi:hypothetical protein